MNSKILMVAAALTLCAPFGAFANEKHDKDLIKSLNLQGNRAEQVEKIMENYSDQAEQVKESAKEQLSNLRDQKEDQLKSVLSDAEYKRYESLVDTRKEQKGKWAEKCDKDGKWLGMDLD